MFVMTRVLFLICCVVGSSLAIDFDWDKEIVRKYTEVKLISECLGDTFIESWRESAAAASEKCHGEVMNDGYHLAPNALEIIKNEPGMTNFLTEKQSGPASPSNVFHPTRLQYPSNNQAPQPVFLKLLQPNQPLYNPYTHNRLYDQQSQYFGYPDRRIWGRSMKDDKVKTRTSKDLKFSSSQEANSDEMDALYYFQMLPKLALLKERVVSKISNMTCVLKKMELINEDGFPNYQHNKRVIERTPLPQTLKENLLEGQEFCKEFSMCVPADKITNPLVGEIGRSFVFLRCFKKAIFQACMINDITKASNGVKVGLGLHDKSELENTLRENYYYGPQDTIKDIEGILDSQSEIGFGF